VDIDCGTGLLVWLAPVARSRCVMLGSFIAVQYLLAILFVLLALQPLLGIPVWVIALSSIAFLIPMYAIMTKKWSEPSELMEPTPNECWKANIFYYNPNDAALVVE
jgi:uncharacterized membrane protein